MQRNRLCWEQMNFSAGVPREQRWLEELVREHLRPSPTGGVSPPSTAPGARSEGICKADELWQEGFLPKEVLEMRKRRI